MDKNEKKAAKLHALQAKFASQLVDRVATVREIWSKIQSGTNDKQLEHDLYLQVHGLVGAAATFGFAEVGQVASQIEQQLVALGNELPDSTLIEEITIHIERLAELANIGAAKWSNERAPSIDGAPEIPLAHSTVYLVEHDCGFADDVCLQLRHFGYSVECFCNIESALAASAKRLPIALIIDVDLLEAEQAESELAECSQVPAIFVSSRDDWQARLVAVRAGAVAYLNKPVDFTHLVEYLDELAGTDERDPYRILVVEDAELVAQQYATVLSDAGMAVELVIDPSELLEKISSFNPELILMDLYMPNCTGLEAVQVIRQKASYDNVPIVYLSTEHALEQQLSALRLGGDDFLEKSISNQHLVAAVSIRAQRFRALRGHMIRDSLTGLLNHIELKLELEREFARANRHNRPLVFAMLDIDHFKSVNDNYGHMAGDRVIKSLSRFLSQRFRKTDVVGRYGGEEFAIILPDTTLATAYTLLDEVRKEFSQLGYVFDGKEIKVTFSAGLASAPPYANVDSLVDEADKALYLAKQAGRNQVVMSSLEEA